MKKLQGEQEIHEIKLPVGTLQHDEFLELADIEVGDKIMTLNGCLRTIQYPFECVGWALVVRKKEGSE